MKNPDLFRPWEWTAENGTTESFHQTEAGELLPGTSPTVAFFIERARDRGMASSLHAGTAQIPQTGPLDAHQLLCILIDPVGGLPDEWFPPAAGRGEGVN